MKPTVLCILDGCGIRKESDGNAFKNAKKTNFDYLMKEYPNSILEASGEAVGLPKGQMGTSEVGHLNIGAGRMIDQPLQKINKSLKDKSLENNKDLLSIFNHVKNNNSNLHIMGLLSDGGVHSSIDHLLGLIDICKINKIENVYFDLFLDGRDVEPKSAIKYIEILENKINETKIGKIATIGGRYFGMDRDNNFDRLKKSYDNICLGEGHIYEDVKKYIEANYKNDITDEFVRPCIVNKNPLSDNDGLIVFNFRKDRIREMLTCITNPSYYEQETLEKKLYLKKYNNLKVLTMYPVVESVKAPSIFKDDDLKNILVDYLHNNNKSQLRLAETEKFAHVTFFFDGGREVEYDDMKKILIPSPKVATYDLKPEMSVYEVTDSFLKEVGNYDVTILNLANGDMVGHTGNYEAAVKAVECMDECLGKIYNKVKELDGKLIVIADHGNCDTMWDENHNPVTSHTTRPVPCIVTDKKIKLNNGRLCDVAPTMLELMNMPIPKEMNGKSLINKNKFSKLFVIISFLIMFALLLTYSIRFIHFYNIEHPKNEIENLLSSKILEEKIVNNNGLTLLNNEYIYKGKVENNYVSYSGYLFRIVKVNKDKSIKLVTDDITTSLVWGYHTDYENSYIKKYLEEVFYNSLVNKDKYLLESNWCIDSIKKKTDVCKDIYSSKIGLLTYNDYKLANSNNSYLNINKYWWTMNTYDDSKVWYVFDEGGVNNKSDDESTYYSFGVRPSIVINPNVQFISGNGTKENPYIIDKYTEVNVGSYVNYSNYIWKVISVNDNIKLVMDDCLKDGEVCLTRKYSNSSSEFNPNSYNTLAYYLNHNFYNTLDDKYIVKGIWNVGKIDAEVSYDYNNIYNDNVEANVGLLNVVENNKIDSFTLTPGSDELIYKLNQDGSLYSSDTDEELNIYPVIYLNKDIVVNNGDGTKENPFIIE